MLDIYVHLTNNSSMLIEFKNKTEINTQQLYKLNKKVIEKLPLEAYAFLPRVTSSNQQG
jgi:hypothetical protein